MLRTLLVFAGGLAAEAFVVLLFWIVPPSPWAAVLLLLALVTIPFATLLAVALVDPVARGNSEQRPER